MVTRLYLEKAENELELSRIIFQITEDSRLQKETFLLKQPLTFYSAVITHSYYSIFYSAKAYLASKGIKTDSPDVHSKTYWALKSFAETGALDLELLKIYEKLMVRADSLLGIFKKEKFKRGHFTYQHLAQANRQPAIESIDNSSDFFRHIYNVCIG